MSWSNRLSIMCLLIQILSSDAAKILAVYPIPSISHQVVFRPITLELIKRGHEVVVITPDPMFPKGEAPQNLTEIDVHDISYEAWAIFMEAAKGNRRDLLSQLKIGVEIILDIVDKQLQNTEVKKIIKGNHSFDILLIEASMNVMLAFSHIYKKPVIQISSHGAGFRNYETMGAPRHPFLYPNQLNQRLYNLTISEKLYELYNLYMIGKIYTDKHSQANEILKRHFGPTVPDSKELFNNVHMLFLNEHKIWEGNVPVPPSVIHLGGLPENPNKDLPAELKSYLDSSKHGVIYFSFGTNVQPSLLPPEKIQIFVKALSKLPCDVLWKWDKDELPGRSANIRISKWLPQSDLLKHPKVKLFVTQGGLQSTDEAITAGVPLIGVPMLGDQWYNVEKYVHHGIGVKLELEDITEESFTDAIKTVIGDESYRNNIIRLRSLMTDQPQKPLERAIWWIEHVLRHGGARHLRAPAANITWTQYLELELVAIVLSALLALVLVSVLIVYSLYRYIIKHFVIKAKFKSS